jgi:hypothetical protein
MYLWVLPMDNIELVIGLKQTNQLVIWADFKICTVVGRLNLKMTIKFGRLNCLKSPSLPRIRKELKSG